MLAALRATAPPATPPAVEQTINSGSQAAQTSAVLGSSEIPVSTSMPNSGGSSAGKESSQLLVAGLGDAFNYKKIFEDGKAAPAKGGLYVAHLVNQRCSEVRSIGATNADISANRPHAEAYKIQAARERLSMMCGGMIDDDVSVRTGYGDVMRQSNWRDDPLLRLQEDYSKSFASGDAAGISTVLGKTLQLPSPEFFLNLMLPMKDGAYYFDGKSYPLGETGAKVLEAAKMLAACDIWSKCGSETDYYIMRACAAEGICTSSYKGLVAASLTADQLRNAQQIAKVMAAAASSGDLSPFVPKK